MNAIVTIDLVSLNNIQNCEPLRSFYEIWVDYGVGRAPLFSLWVIFVLSNNNNLIAKGNWEIQKIYFVCILLIKGVR